MKTGPDYNLVGFAGESEPRCRWPAVIGVSKTTDTNPDVMGYAREYFVGEEALALRGVLRLGWPVGRSCNFIDIEKIWHYTFFSDLRVDPSEYAIAYLFDTDRPLDFLRKIAENLFDTFNVQGVAPMNAQQAALVGESTGPTALVVNIEPLRTICVPVVNYLPLYDFTLSTPVGAESVELFIARELEKAGYQPGSGVMDRVAHLIKSKYCYFGPPGKYTRRHLEDFQEELYTGQDFPEVDLSFIAHGAPATLFRGGPSQALPVDKCILNAIELCSEGSLWDKSWHLSRFGTTPTLDRPSSWPILVYGEASSIPGFFPFLQKRLKAGWPENVRAKFKVTPPANPLACDWIGGSKLASSHAWGSYCVTREAYKRHGTDVINFMDDVIAQHQ